MRLHLFALCFFALIVTNSMAEQGQVTPAESPFRDYKDVEWVNLEGAAGQKFLTAILRPEGAGPFAVIVILHGANGLTRDHISLAKEMSQAGFLTVVGCWMRPLVVPKPCIEATSETDAGAEPTRNSGKELISFARQLPNARPDRIGLFGLGRGGHAALWAASTGTNVQAVVVVSPGHVPNTIVLPPKPLQMIDTLDAPVLSIHGTEDQISPVSQSCEYEQAARAAKKNVTTHYVEGGGHLATMGFGSDAVLQEAITYLKARLMK